MQIIAQLLLLFPLLGFLAIGLFQKLISKNLAGVVASSLVFFNLIISFVLFWYVSTTGQTVQVNLFDWIQFASISIPFGITVDRLSVLMLLVVNGVGWLIHVYSIGYMKNDEGVNRFFSYMNLFIFFMLILVLSSNYLMMFIGWEGVGLCSYLLIGFWYKDHANNNAAKKAFIMNRIGDLGFLIATFMLIHTFGTLNISDVANKAMIMPSGNTALLIITLGLFMGAIGKSAQIPLFTWLPDAMAGPTPVSALIHAATMVTAGVYLVARSSVIFVLEPFTMNLILVIGAITAAISGLIAIYQYDIKKILAYSTVSQLGFMFMALGLGSFSGAMFHLTMHAFFKALLFLGAGSVIHALNQEQDIRNMGGLRKKIPATFFMFLIASIAISGIPPFAGFFSKEYILSAAYEHGMATGIIATLISLLTTIYMFRMVFIAFYKPESNAVKTNHHIHESPKVMLIPMAVLTVLSMIGGFVQIPALFGSDKVFSNYLSPMFATAHQIAPMPEQALGIGTEWLTLLIPLTIIALLIVWLYHRFAKDHEAVKLTGIETIMARKFYFDEIYDFCVVKPVERLSIFLRETIDQGIINRFVNSVGQGTLYIGAKIRLLQTGNIGFYLMIMVFSIIALLLFNLIR
ncbi:NADH-quinone oxidoreductase subunit L [Microbacter margulisiae]|uniref:NADH-quinone oxidoreductase subunit L n=1 Tax=Microbacter margulisiae TaxID=1350067 RepID=A0A7W5DQ71_9PORP|nr:NADH-quinone oxidoreductase subunit L [Microbacter margulisiae]MBB3186298.1 NADH-quinone oxidoreductase subunit L [Microbacter margulisiae]